MIWKIGRTQEKFRLNMIYEQKGIGAPAANVLNNRVNIFYQTYGAWKLDAICHAVSSDGIHFEKNHGNTIYLPTNNWCCSRAIDADVCY